MKKRRTTTTTTCSSSSSAVTTIDSWQELMTKLEEAAKSSTPVVMEFMAPWSEPSRAMEQPFRDFANGWMSNPEKPQAVRFVAVDLDKFKNLGRSLGVEALPTFLLVKKQVKKWYVEDSIVAVDGDDLRDKLKKMINDSTEAKSG